jgi:hypothetical protein
LIEIKADDELSLLKIPLSLVSPDLQENIRTDDDMRISLEDYIRTFKLGNIKNKKRVFTTMKGVKDAQGEGAAAEQHEPDDE